MLNLSHSSLSATQNINDLGQKTETYFEQLLNKNTDEVGEMENDGDSLYNRFKEKYNNKNSTMQELRKIAKNGDKKSVFQVLKLTNKIKRKLNNKLEYLDEIRDGYELGSQITLWGSLVCLLPIYGIARLYTGGPLYIHGEQIQYKTKQDFWNNIANDFFTKMLLDPIIFIPIIISAIALPTHFHQNNKIKRIEKHQKQILLIKKEWNLIQADTISRASSRKSKNICKIEDQIHQDIGHFFRKNTDDNADEVALCNKFKKYTQGSTINKPKNIVKNGTKVEALQALSLQTTFKKNYKNKLEHLDTSRRNYKFLNTTSNVGIFAFVVPPLAKFTANIFAIDVLAQKGLKKSCVEYITNPWGYVSFAVSIVSAITSYYTNNKINGIEKHQKRVQYMNKEFESVWQDMMDEITH